MKWSETKQNETKYNGLNQNADRVRISVRKGSERSDNPPQLFAADLSEPNRTQPNPTEPYLSDTQFNTLYNNMRQKTRQDARLPFLSNGSCTAPFERS
mmetsp:Transcript_29380/g.69063  ORF Transcript_29380/g.69063 Transcript_29380/m.69063 type:complete len:98 (+) Transcript_29380:3-296(+)